MSRTHFAITSDSSGNAVRIPLKAWMRQHFPTEYPSLNPDLRNTSYIRKALVKQHQWQLVSSIDEVLLIKPDDNGSFDYAGNIVDQIEDEAEEETAEEAAEELAEVTFSLERDMQAALRRNITSLSQGLQIIDGGNERTTQAGRIDITAQEANGTIVVIELKAGIAKPEALTQLLAYVTSLKDEGNSSVRGILVAQEFHDKLKLAARSVDCVELFDYRFQFTFNRI